MFDILLYSFAKKESSTKIPVNETPLTISGVLKEPSSITNPIIRIEPLPGNVSPHQYTYAYINTFARMYFIEDWVWADGLWEVHMKVDVLASFRNQIGAQTEYVLRTDSLTDFNGEITDTTYPATTDYITRSYISSNNPFPSAINVGCYIVGIISGNSPTAVGAISYYAMDSYQFGQLKQALLSEDNLITMGLAILDPSTGQLTPTVQDISLEVLKTMYNPFQYIVSCMWFPFPLTEIPSSAQVTQIKIGWWEYTLNGAIIDAQLATFAEDLPITTHPQASRGTYLNYSPYVRRTLIGRFGTIALDNAYFDSGFNRVGIEYVVDLITGQCKAGIERLQQHGSGFDSDIITQREFLLGVPIQLAQVGTDYLGTALQSMGLGGNLLGGAVAGFATGGVGGAVAGAISSTASGIYNSISTAMPQMETSGQNGSFLSVNNVTRLIEQFFIIVDEDIGHRGRPLCELRQLNTLSGFILCAEGELDISCYDNERKEIVQYLTTGFFWE